MKKVYKYLGIAIAIFVILIAGGLLYFNFTYPKVSPPPVVTIEVTPELIARGDYLTNHVALCTDCHGLRDYTKFAAPLIPGTYGAGGELWSEEVGFPGSLYSKNITYDNETGLGSWSDGEVVRAITMGVDKKGSALFPLMPYNNYNQMAEADLYAIIAYLKTIEPKKNIIPERKLNFPLNILVRTMPLQEYNATKNVNKNNPVEYGKYLTTIASCQDCHTKSDMGEPIPGMEFAGGNEFPMGKKVIRAVNITPDEETGIGRWTKEEFIERFKSNSPDVKPEEVVADAEFNTIMPWRMYAGMTEEDLSAIYEYLRSVKPVKNKVERFSLMTASQ
jgi:mono/diheme cytochrome c family protein